MIITKIAEGKNYLTPQEIKETLWETFGKLGDRKRVLAVPPDITRYHSFAGFLTELAYEYYGGKLVDVLPALGTHNEMTAKEINYMYPTVPPELFRYHDWRHGLSTLGEVPLNYIKEISENKVDYSIPIQVDKLLTEGNHDLILSIGQVVPHEVSGMANYTKNIFIGTGGAEGINKSHFLGAAYGMERIMGRANTPVRKVLNYGADNFAKHLPIVYIMTVVGKDENGKLGIKGLFIGDEHECFNQAAALSLQENFIMLEKPLKKVVVFLDPAEYRTTWLGNKSIYRTRMAIDDGGELIVLAPAVKGFGEDPGNDKIIGKYGYVGIDKVLKLTKENEDLQNALGAAAHLIHGSSEGRFEITYCPGNLSKEAVEGVNFRFGDINKVMQKYNPEKLTDGYNIVDGEEVFYISNPALGLWAYRDRFN
ncbi:MAG: lactate racemase domain-containing protein [Ignavibacteriaceae bacterium]